MRYVFIEGQNQEKYEPARQLIQKIVEDHKRIQENFANHGEINPFPGPHTSYYIPDIATDMIIGKDGQTLKQIYQKTNCYIFVSDQMNQSNERMLQFSGGAGPAGNQNPQKLLNEIQFSEEEMRDFKMTKEQYLSLSLIDKCKLEIRLKMSRLEKFALDQQLPLSTETVLKFIDS